MNRDASGQKCPSCETGRQTLLLDRREPFCPYVHFNKGIPGEFKSLSDDDQQTLQAVIRTAVPYFDI